MPGKGARNGGLNIPYDSIERAEQFLFSAGHDPRPQNTTAKAA
jgi:hypothetical protein